MLKLEVENIFVILWVLSFKYKIYKVNFSSWKLGSNKINSMLLKINYYQYKMFSKLYSSLAQWDINNLTSCEHSLYPTHALTFWLS